MIGSSASLTPPTLISLISSAPAMARLATSVSNARQDFGTIVPMIFLPSSLLVGGKAMPARALRQCGLAANLARAPKQNGPALRRAVVALHAPMVTARVPLAISDRPASVATPD